MLVRIPIKITSYQASIQCRAIICTPAKHNLMAFRWQADDGPLIVLFFNLPPLIKLKKNVVKVGPPLTKLSGPAHVRLADAQAGPLLFACKKSVFLSVCPYMNYSFDDQKGLFSYIFQYYG